MKKIFLTGILSLLYLIVFAQTDSLDEKTLEEIVISINKWEQKLNEVPNKVVKISKSDILRNNPQTSADLLGQSGTIFIQKSQLGGGSPMIRGFATNRVLLVVDGVRMNNAIYRSGNLQNVISIDALSTEAVEVIFGPGSLIYGSDAIGGVMDFHTLAPRLSKDLKTLTTGSVLARYSTADKEKTIHADINVGWKKWAALSSFSFSSFDDLKMGRNGKKGQENYLRPEYVERINGKDSIFQNNDPRVQRFSGYQQVNFIQKVRFKPNPFWNIQYSYVQAVTGDAPRYDRLIQYRNGALRFAEWNYGPMNWKMHNLNIFHKKKSGLYDEAKIIIAYQDYEESRIDRRRGNNIRTTQTERVDALSANIDASKSFGESRSANGEGQLFYGLEYVYNKVFSRGEQTNIDNKSHIPSVSRYPNGSIWSSAGAYMSYRINPNPKLTLTTGIRYSYNILKANFDTTFIKFPFQKAILKDGAFTGNAGLVFRPAENWQLNGNISSGYRMPNIDDIGKLFESVPGNVTVPNPGLTPEYAWNFEIGIIKNIHRKFRVEVNAFHTILNHAIVRRTGTFNGQDSIIFDGVKSQVESLQNVAKAHVTGLQASIKVSMAKDFSFLTYANWISGKETDEEKNEQVPLRHAPPFYGSSVLRYSIKKFVAEINVQYNSQIKNEDLAPSEKAKTDIYAKDTNGKPYSPGWYTVNLKTMYQIAQKLQLTVGWENLTNQRYRPYSSGIVAAGSNLVIACRFQF